MKNPGFLGDDCGEFFEVYNTTSSDIGILGWVFGDTDTSCAALGDDFVTADVVIPANSYFVFADQEDSGVCPDGDGVTPDVEYTGFVLANGADEVLICVDGFLLDAVSYSDGPFPDPNGASFGLDPAVGFGGDNNLGSNWCDQTSAIGGGTPDLGTPGTPNDPCF
jgi:hypothetical protein